MAIILGSFAGGSVADEDWQIVSASSYMYNNVYWIGVGIARPSGIFHISGAGNILNSGVILHDITDPSKAVLWLTSGVNADGAPQLTGVDISTLVL